MLFLVKFFLAASAIIVIILVMLQRGKGGGLAGALGGMGGQSAFGTKAGDLFTKITVGVAAFWILISVLTAIYAPYLSRDSFLTAKQYADECRATARTPRSPPTAARTRGAKRQPPVPRRRAAKRQLPSSTGEGATRRRAAWRRARRERRR